VIVRSNTLRNSSGPSIGNNYFLDDEEDSSDKNRGRPTLDTDDRHVSTPTRFMRDRRAIVESGSVNEVDESALYIKEDLEEDEDRDLSYVRSGDLDSDDS